MFAHRRTREIILQGSFDFESNRYLLFLHDIITTESSMRSKTVFLCNKVSLLISNIPVYSRAYTNNKIRFKSNCFEIDTLWIQC